MDVIRELFKKNGLKFPEELIKLCEKYLVGQNNPDPCAAAIVGIHCYLGKVKFYP